MSLLILPREKIRGKKWVSEFSPASYKANSGNLMPSQKFNQEKILGRDFDRIKKILVKETIEAIVNLKKYYDYFTVQYSSIIQKLEQGNNRLDFSLILD